MKKSEWNEALNHIDDDLVESYVAQKELLSKKKKSRGIWLRVGAIAATVAMIFGVVAAVSMFIWRGDNDDHSYNESDQIPIWSSPKLSMSDLYGTPQASPDNNDSYDGENSMISANAHQGVFVSNAENLNIVKIKDDEYIPIYYRKNYFGKELNENEFNDFFDGVLPNIASYFNIDVSKIERNDKNEAFEYYGAFDNIELEAYQNKWKNGFSIKQKYYDENTMNFNGKPIRVDKTKSDAEIIDSLEDVKEKIFELFGVSFTDVTVIRHVYEGGVFSIVVCFYNAGEYSYKINSYDDYSYDLINEVSFGDRITIVFNNNRRFDGDDFDDIVSAESINYAIEREKFGECYNILAQARRITIEEAENFLRKGYTIGGTYKKCYNCSRKYDDLDFENYEFLEIQYFSESLTNADVNLYIPYYVFYKKLPIYDRSYEVYETVTVPAIELIGYEEYFSNGKNNSTK